MYSHKIVGTFTCAQIELRRTRECELATLDEKSTSSGIAAPCPIKMEGKNRGEEGMTSVTMACPEEVEKWMCMIRKNSKPSSYEVRTRHHRHRRGNRGGAQNEPEDESTNLISARERFCTAASRANDLPARGDLAERSAESSNECNFFFCASYAMRSTSVEMPPSDITGVETTHTVIRRITCSRAPAQGACETNEDSKQQRQRRLRRLSLPQQRRRWSFTYLNVLVRFHLSCRVRSDAGLGPPLSLGGMGVGGR